MNFVQHGPDIPEHLLQAHEDGQVVFFCGAGISYPAGLPDFKGLVDAIYNQIGTSREPIEELAYESGQYDATLNLLERRIPGNRQVVRRGLGEVLKPRLRRKGAMDTHAALLQLARDRKGAVRLVTTNFDRIFQELIGRTKSDIASFSAPQLPVPKDSRWNGVVYLHGLLPIKPEESDLNRLVLTSGDFGLAYLTERWAARFVSELFRNYVVCFVGYSIHDPVLRYMMDALAADRMSGEFTPHAYALGPTEPGKEKASTQEWEAKGVTPILYELPEYERDHSNLHRTLKAWAEIYRDGILGKERIVVECAAALPSACTKQDDFVSRMLWALSDASGQPAKRFADCEPVPSLEWLAQLSETRFRHEDLQRFGVTPMQAHNDKLAFSLLNRPASYLRAPMMSLVTNGANMPWPDKVMCHLARWLVRHLNDPALVLWVSKCGSELHQYFTSLIEQKIDEIAGLEREGKAVELDRLKANASNAIPSAPMLTIWSLVLTKRIKSPWHDGDLYDWKRRFNRDGLTSILRIELRSLLAPKITFQEPFLTREKSPDSNEPTVVSHLLGWELKLTADNINSVRRDLEKSEAWQLALPSLLEDFQQLLRDALDLMRELGEADDRNDNSTWHLPSISPHSQNRGFHDWVALIELLRDAWLAINKTDQSRAVRTAHDWFARPYATFKRLAFFAASQENVIAAKLWIDWLLADDSWWLWATETKRESLRLLVLQGQKISTEAKARLEAAILAGPPRDFYRPDIDNTWWHEMVGHSVWLRLAKLRAGGTVLGDSAAIALEALESSNPTWQLADNQSDEFSHWMSGTGDPDFEAQRVIDRAPRTRRELVKWLEREPIEDPFLDHDWRDVCQEKFATAVCALCALASKGQWPAERWRDALSVWSQEKFTQRSWRYVAPLLENMPDDDYYAVVHNVSWWLGAVSQHSIQQEAKFIYLCQRIVQLPQADYESGAHPVFSAINSPFGQTAQALLNVWFRREPNDDNGLPEDIESIFSSLCDTAISAYRPARVVFASYLIALFRADPSWTQLHLLPAFRWRVSAEEARGVWEGFLRAPRLYRPLLECFKADFLETANQYSVINENARNYAAILTYAALDPGVSFSNVELSEAISGLPEKGLVNAAQALVQAMEGAGDRREEYWKNRVAPFWRNVWPKSKELLSKPLAEQLARLTIAAGGEFPAALNEVKHWLLQLDHPNYTVHLLSESGLCSRFPKESLTLLNLAIASNNVPPLDLSNCLDSIKKSFPGAEYDLAYKALVNYIG